MNDKRLPARAAQAHRDQLASLPLIDELARILTILSIGYSPVYAQPPAHASAKELVYAKPRVLEWRPVGKDDIARYSLLLKTVEALLRKILPDLKAIEVTDRSEDKRTLTDVELAQRIAGVLSEVKGSVVDPSVATGASATEGSTGPAGELNPFGLN